MATPPASTLRTLTLLLAAQYRMWVNSLRESVRKSPVRVITIGGSIAVVWWGIHHVFHETFARLQLQETYGGHAIHFLLLLFFMALTVMLFFSNAIILFTGLTRSREMDFLMASPAPPGAIFLYKYVEAMAYASWALLLLAVPLVTAFTTAMRLPDWFVLVFLAFLLVFIPIPAAAGSAAALLVGRFAPRQPMRILAAGLAVVLAGLAYWLYLLYQVGPGQMVSPWDAINRIFERLRFMDNPAMPGYWLTQGLEHASNHRYADAGFYFAVTATNALFLNTWVVVLGRRLIGPIAASAGTAGGRTRVAGGRFEAAVDVAFFYLPTAWRLLIAKDLRLFVRDAAQWSQCLIFLLLLSLYMLNVPRLSEYLGSSRGQLLLAGMNTVAAGLITAVFTSRFVFPMLSLEGRRFWALGTAPMGRPALVLAKFVYSVFMCGIVATGLVLIGCLRLEIPAAALVLCVLLAACMCLGLSAIAVGSGAKWPNFKEDNAAKIAGGFGGTLNLLLSLAFLAGLIIPPVLALSTQVALSLATAAASAGPDAGPPWRPWLPWAAAGWVVAFTAFATAVPLWEGVRSLRRWEP
mgnify:CR=1 FL=1